MTRKKAKKAPVVPGRKYGSRTRRLSVKVPPAIDKEARRRARREDVPVSDILVAALAEAFGVDLGEPKTEGVFE